MAEQRRQPGNAPAGSGRWHAFMRILGLLALCLPFSPQAGAHYLDIAQFTFFQQAEPGHYRLLVDNLPQSLIPRQPVGLPEGCELLSRRESQPGFLPSVELSFRCDPGTAGILETEWGRDGGMLEWRFLDGRSDTRMLTGGRTGTRLTLPDWQAGQAESRSFLQTAWLYLVLGTEHVLIGLDHLAFVFCLAMLARGRGLLYLITAFTVGHSLSLALSYLGIVRVSITPVEAVIALSVVFMAREAILHQRARLRGDTESGGLHSTRGRVALTAGFGLIHGLGFASVLSDLGVSPGDTLTALAFFNIGVEVGQVLFVSAVLLLVMASRQVRLDRPLVRLSLNVIGGMGLFWTLQRVIGI